MTDGNTKSEPYLGGPRVVEIDFEDPIEINTIRIWQFWADGRTYLNRKIAFDTKSGEEIGLTTSCSGQIGEAQDQKGNKIGFRTNQTVHRIKRMYKMTPSDHMSASRPYLPTPATVFRRFSTSGAKYCGVPQKVFSPSRVVRFASPKSVILTHIGCTQAGRGIRKLHRDRRA